MPDSLASEPIVDGREMYIARLLDAPRELVWEVWTDPEHIRHWWGPTGFTNSIDHMDVRPGGSWQFVMHGPDGTDYRNEHHYLEVVKPERLVLEHVTGPKFRMTVTFTAEGEKTLLQIRSQFESEEQLAHVIRTFGAKEGLHQNVERMEAYLGKRPLPLIVERSYAATPGQIWSALTDPDQMKMWYFDLPGFRAEPGYQFRFEGGPPEKTYLHLCEVTEVDPGKTLAYSWRYDGYTGQSLVRFDIIPVGEKTKVRVTHSGLETFPASNPDLAAGNFKAGWTAILGESLKQFLAGTN